MKKLLLLTDFSDASRHALQYVRSFFSDTATNIHLLCVYPVEPDGFYTARHVAQTAHTAFADHLHELVAELRSEASNDWHTFSSSALPGNLPDVVQAYVDAEDYDYVVIGAKKDGTNALFGNSATMLLRQLKANLLIIPVDAPVKPVSQVVVALDLANLKNGKVLGPVREFVALKGASLTLLTIDTPGEKATLAEQEVHIRQLLSPVQPTLIRWQAPDVKQGIESYLTEHPVDLLVTIPKHKGWTDILTGNSVTRLLAYAPPVPLLTLYDDGHTDQLQRIDDLSNVDCAL